MSEMHRDGDEDERDDVGRLLLEVLVLLLHQDGGRGGLAADVAGDDLDRPELSQRPRQAQHDAVHDRPLDAGQSDPPEGLQRVGAQAVGGLFLLVAHVLEDGHDLADHQRQGHEDGGHDHARHREHDLEAVVLQGRAEPAVPAVVDQDQGQAHHDGRHRQRQVDERRERPLPRELVAHQDQRHPHTEEQVDQDRDHGDLDAQLKGVDDVRVAQGVLERLGAALERPPEDQRRRPGDQEEEVADDQQSQAPLEDRVAGADDVALTASHGAPTSSGSRRR